jgi:hypothetical protein
MEQLHETIPAVRARDLTLGLRELLEGRVEIGERVVGEVARAAVVQHERHGPIGTGRRGEDRDRSSPGVAGDHGTLDTQRVGQSPYERRELLERVVLVARARRAAEARCVDRKHAVPGTGEWFRRDGEGRAAVARPERVPEHDRHAVGPPQLPYGDG